MRTKKHPDSFARWVITVAGGTFLGTAVTLSLIAITLDLLGATKPIMVIALLVSLVALSTVPIALLTARRGELGDCEVRWERVFILAFGLTAIAPIAVVGIPFYFVTAWFFNEYLTISPSVSKVGLFARAPLLHK